MRIRYRHPVTDTATDPFACVVPDTSTERAFTWSMVVSGVRCTLTYVIFPFVTPLIGLAPGVGPAIGLGVGTVAIASNVIGFRRFGRSTHRWRKPAMVIHAGVTGLLLVMMAIDAGALLS